MLRKNLASILVVAAAVSFSLTAGCKKKQAASTKGGDDMSGGMPAMKVAMKAGDEMAADMRARPADSMAPRAAIVPGRAGALPIPADFMFVHINLKAARGTALYKQFEPKIKELIEKSMAKEKMAKALLETCKLNPMSTVDDLMVGVSMAGGKDTAVIAVLKGSFDTAKVMACMKPEMAKNKIPPTDVTIAGKKGIKFKVKNEESTVIMLSANTFAMADDKMQSKLAAVLSGKLGSIEDSPMYKEYAPQANKDTVLTMLVPTVPAAATASLPLPILKDIKSVAMMLGLPGGGLDLKVALNIGDKTKAEKLAKSLPLLVNLAKAKLPQVGATIAQNLKVNADNGWVKMALVLNKADFGKLVDTVKGMLGGVLKVRSKGATNAKEPAKVTPKAAMK